MASIPLETTYLPPAPSAVAWQDAAWLQFRAQTERPRLLYHLRLHAWRHSEANPPLSCRDLVAGLVPYLKKSGYTGIVLATDELPHSSHPSVLNTLPDWVYLINQLHQAGLSLMLDWHPGTVADWKSPAVRAALCRNARLWLERYHLDGLRIVVPDPARFLPGTGCAELLEELKQTLADRKGGDLLLACPVPVPGFDCWQEHSIRPLVDLFRGLAPVPSPELSRGGTLSLPVPSPQKDAQSFPASFSGSDVHRRAAARACYLTFLALPGGKLVSMGTELGQVIASRSDSPLNWRLLKQPEWRQYHDFFQTANNLFLSQPVLWSTQPNGFRALPDACDTLAALAFLRRAGPDTLLCLCNPTVSQIFCTLPEGWGRESCHLLFSSDAERFGGTNSSCWLPSTDPDAKLRQLAIPPLTCILLSQNPSSDGLHLR